MKHAKLLNDLIISIPTLKIGTAMKLIANPTNGRYSIFDNAKLLLKNGTNKHLSSINIQHLAVRVLGLGILMLGTLILGCNHNQEPSNNATDQHHNSVDASGGAFDEVVILTSDDILSTKTELYQPSYNLYGQLAPINEIKILALDEAYVSDIFVNNGEQVSINQPLIKLRLNMNNISTESDHLSNNTADDTKPDTLTTDEQRVLSQDASFDTLEAADKTRPKDAPQREFTTPDKASSNNQDIRSTDNVDQPNAQADRIDLTQPSKQAEFITITAPQAGKVTNLLATVNSRVYKDQLLLVLADTSQLQLIGELPLLTEAPNINDAPVQTESQLPIGQAVNFTVYAIDQQFSGQISQTAPNKDSNMLTVHALVNQSEDTIATLDEGMQVTMNVNYGQTNIGVRIPRRSIHEVDLSELNEKHNRPVAPLHGYVWVIGQDQRLSRKPVKVIEYDHKTDQFLVSGISNDSLISLADLPVSKEGSLVKIE